MAQIQVAKNSFRELYKVIRMGASINKYEFGLANNVSKVLQIIKPSLIGSYMPLKHQIVPPLLIDYKYAYPIHSQKDKVLKYISVDDNSKFQKSLYKIKVPIIKNSDSYTHPDMIFVPLLCFDNKKNRLGYGGGYFDETIKFYRNNKIPCKFIGLGVDILKVDQVPVNQNDQILDYVITQNNIYQ